MNLVITIYATQHHAYALAQQSARTMACLNYAGVDKAVIILVTDNSSEAAKGVQAYTDNAPEGISIQQIKLTPGTELQPSYQNNPDLQVLIARLQHVAWTAARKLRPDFVWSLESDVMPPANALTVMLDALRFDRGIYDIAMCTYPNEGFLGGRTIPGHWIAPDVYEDEREISEEIKKEIEARAEAIAELNTKSAQPTVQQIAAWRDLDIKIKSQPQKGNVHALNGARWRRRGWLESAYPGVGWGAILPTDWVGLGCTLLSTTALNLAHFEGYNGQGTQDLWLVHNCWTKLNMCVIPHALAHHIKRDSGDTSKLNVLFAKHEEGGECDGHLRSNKMPWREIS